MGLDMYLSAKKYVSGWGHSKPEDQKLQTTATMLQKLLDNKKFEGWDFYYCSSW